MKGCTISEFMDDVLAVGGPEKEFVFRKRFFFLQTLFRKEKGLLELYLEEYDNTDPKDKVYIRTHSFWGSSFAECVAQFEVAHIFEGLTIYEAEQEIEVLFG